MNFEENFNQYLARLKKIEPQLSALTEESTKTSLVMPFFAMLGYDVFNVEEFMPEYTCDIATKKGEKIDYAILKDGDPVMLIEAKRAGMKLQKQQQGQLFRYFSTNRCRIAILTNGIVYQFYSDLNAPNVMDDEPFLTFNLLEDDTNLYLASIHQFSKEKFNIKNVIQKAVYQKYSEVVQKTLKDDLLSPSDEIVKYFLSRPEIKTGNRITSQMIEKHREATQKAMQKVFGATIQSVINVPDESIQIQEEPHNSDHETPSIKEPVGIQDISAEIKRIANELVAECKCIAEDMPDFLRLHIYTTGNQKAATIKIMKSDMSIQLRKFSNGMPISVSLTSVAELKEYL